jgi:hypothetical protein
MKTKFWIISILSGLFTGMVIAVIITYQDWQLNPSGIFHGEQGTNWPVVWETALSWLLPIWALVSALLLICLLIISRLRSKPSSREN